MTSPPASSALSHMSAPDYLQVLFQELAGEHPDRFGCRRFTPQHRERMVIALDEHFVMCLLNSYNGDYKGIDVIADSRYAERMPIEQLNCNLPAISFADIPKRRLDQMRRE